MTNEELAVIKAAEEYADTEWPKYSKTGRAVTELDKVPEMVQAVRAMRESRKKYRIKPGANGNYLVVDAYGQIWASCGLHSYAEQICNALNV